MATINIQELSPATAEAIKRALAHGEEVFLTNDKNEHLAILTSVGEPTAISSSKQERNLFGSMKGVVQYMAEDFNEPLEDFKDYMPE